MILLLLFNIVVEDHILEDQGIRISSWLYKAGSRKGGLQDWNKRVLEESKMLR